VQPTATAEVKFNKISWRETMNEINDGVQFRFSSTQQCCNAIHLQS